MPPKRKRPERPSDSGPSRPAPHRPGDTSLGRHDGGYEGGGRGRRGRGSDRRDSSQSFNARPPSSGAVPASLTPTVGRPSSSSSAAPVASVNTQVISTPAPPSPPSSPIQPGYFYGIVTDDRIERWKQGARHEVVDHGIQSRDDEDLLEVTMIFQELLHAVTEGKLPGADAGGVTKEILGPELVEADRATMAFDPHTLFLDTLSTFMEIHSSSYRPQLGEMVRATGVSPALMRIVLDAPILQSLDLIRDTFGRMGVRHATNLLYRQANYNLLREETEGYSKLMTELFTTSNAEPPSSKVVQDAFNKVMGLIGTFDLHPGRVLDVTLDIFAAVLVKHCNFFVKFLRVSSWWPRTESSGQPRTPLGVDVGGLPVWALPDHFGWNTTEEEEAVLTAERLKRDISFWERARQIKLDAFFELGGRQLTPAEEQRLTNGAAEDGQETSIEKEWIKLTKTLPPTGNRDAAQMLGFKLRFYASDIRDKDDILPLNLLCLVALLIKIGFISITDLWNHLWPLEEEMESFRVKKMKEMEEKEKAARPGGEPNALMMAGALPDDMPPPSSMSRRDGPSKTDDASKAATGSAKPEDKMPEPEEQKALLLGSLLTIGALPESLFIIGRHNWLLDAFPDKLRPLLFRILHHSLDSVFQQSAPVASRAVETPAKKQPALDQPTKPAIKLVSPPLRRALKWPFADQQETPEGGIGPYRFYWDEWADNVPVCQSVDDVFTLCDTLLNIVGVNIGRDAALMSKLASIGRKSLADDQSDENKARWLVLLKRLLVPALSLSDANSSLVETVWTLLKQYPIKVRYNVYAEWYEGSISRLEPIKKAFARTRLETLANMKRLSLTNIPQMAKSLAKIAYPSPGILCKVALSQIESYSNLIDAFVECVKYFTDLGYDVLVWSVLSSIGGQRNRTQEDSVLLTSKWLQALSKFSGKVFQRYSNMNPVPILRYVNDQLFKGNSTDLLILRELIESMGGVVSDLDFTDAQLRAMTGGELLRRETLISLGDKRSVSVRSADRLIKSLVDTKLAGRLLINIAQYRQNAIYRVDGAAHIKYLSTVVDDTHQILLQYLDLLRSGLDGETFNNLVPGVIQLMKDFGLEAGLAFMIGRASIRLDMNAGKSPKDNQPTTQPSRSTTDNDGDVSMDAPIEDEESKTNGPDDKIEADAKAVSSRKGDPLVDALQPLIDEVPNVLADGSWRYVSPAGYVFFWSLQLGDFSFPIENYTAESAKLVRQAEDVMKDRTDMTRAGMNKKTQKRKDILDRQQLLLKENSQGVQQFSKTRLQIAKQLNSWFPAEISKADATSDALLEECILPRLQISPLDAEYCFKLIKFLHEFSAPNFKLMSLYDRLFNHNRLRAMIFTCTVREAEHFGRFLRCILGDLSRWHGDKAVYEKEALGMKELQGKKTKQYLGFATALDTDGKPTATVEHDQFRDLLFKWHKELNSALRTCLDGLEWMHIRNAITILKSVIDFFPAINFMADKFLQQLKTITEREAASKAASESEQGHRVDLSVTAQTAYSELQKRKSKWILVQAFRPGLSADSRDERRGSVPSNSALRASAPEFKPTDRKQTAGEVEDGEVKDSKGTIAVNGSSENKTVPLVKHPLPTREPPKESTTEASLRANSTAASSSKPATPKGLPAVPVSASGNRTESGRFSTLPPVAHGLPNRPELPSRPEVPYPGRGFGPPRHDGRRDAPPPRDSRDYREPRDSRDSRDTRDTRDTRDPRDPREIHSRENREPLGSRDGRDYRTPDNSRLDRPRDFPPADRRPEPGPREATSRPDRDWPARPEPPPRWNEHPESRPSRERPSHASSRNEPRPPRDHATPSAPPTASSANDAPEPPVNPDRLRHITESARPDIINPARAALISDSRDPPRQSSSSRDQGRDRPSRTDSPRRSDQQPSGVSQPDKPRDDRPPRQRHSDYHSSSRDVHGDGAPSQPRSDRNADREPDRAAAFRDAANSSQSGRSEQDQGRLAQQDPNYGRLNAIPSTADLPPGPPSGPRGRGRNTARAASLNQPSPLRSDGRFPGQEPARPSSPDRHPPTGPSSSRPRRGQYDSSNVNSPTSAAPPGVGVHPDRARLVGQQPPSGPSTPSAPSAAPTAPAPSGIHPDRLDRIGGPGSGPGPRPPIHTPDRPAASAPNSAARPSPLNTEFPPPTGPSASNDRVRPGGNRQLHRIQGTLEKAAADSRGPQFRPSRQRQSLAGSDAQILAGSSPVTTPIQERQDPIVDRAPRPEPIQVVSDSRDGRSGRNGDDHGASRDHERSSRRDHHRPDRSNRTSRRNSRERSPDRERENKDGSSYRDRRTESAGGAVSNNRDGDRDPTGSRRSVRDSTSARDSLPGGRDMAPPRESSHRSHRTDPIRGEPIPSLGGRGGEDYSNGGRGGSSRANGAPRDSRSSRPDDPRGGEPRGDPRGEPRGDDRGRKRRSEGPIEPPGSHVEKRPRR